MLMHAKEVMDLIPKSNSPFILTKLAHFQRYYTKDKNSHDGV